MVFNSLQYLVFFPLVLAVYWASPFRFRVPILLIASYIFYMAWRPVYIFLILGLTALNYWLGLRIGACREKEGKKAWMIAAVVANVATLAFFKYFYLLEDAVRLAVAPLGLELAKLPIDIILPLGISFFVFEFIHYVVDVYKGTPPVRNFIEFALFPSFFPTQIAGPIKRVQDFVPQLKVPTELNRENLDQGSYLILNGLFKKVLLADNLSVFISGGFANPAAFTAGDIWLFGWAFSLQVYFDFSGYADIARGSALLLGFKVPINFVFPYLSGNITEFWRRWHITLGSWLRDYLFFPLGGSRNGRVQAAWNLLVTMTICGLWHGASLHHIVWGAYNGLLLVAHREWARFREAYDWRLLRVLDTKAGHVFSVFLTFSLFSAGNVIFRAETLPKGIEMVKKMFLLDGSSLGAGFNVASINYPLIFPSIFIVLASMFLFQVVILKWFNNVPRENFPRPLRVAYAAAIIFALCAYSPDSSPRFIYYQF